tara:strand:+ start:187 stop:387 length:201 start_codon:yes stop_codon:yes gene_type:complete
MATKKQMLEGLEEMKKILLKSQRGKSKSPIDITTKKGMDKAIKEISKKMNMGGVMKNRGGTFKGVY